MSPMRIFRIASPPLKRQLLMTALILVGAAVVGLSGQSPAPPIVEASWWTPQNLISLGILIYGVGTTVQQARDLGRRVAELEQFKNEQVPDTYVRKDVFEERLGRRVADLRPEGRN